MRFLFAGAPRGVHLFVNPLRRTQRTEANDRQQPRLTSPCPLLFAAAAAPRVCLPRPCVAQSTALTRIIRARSTSGSSGKFWKVRALAAPSDHLLREWKRKKAFEALCSLEEPDGFPCLGHASVDLPANRARPG